MLAMVNHFRAAMPRPIVGVGHSKGAVQLADLALMHPSLFTSLVLLDPALVRRTKPVMVQTTFVSAKRRDWWPSREVAEQAFRKNPAWKSWDPRVMDRLVQVGFRECPTLLKEETSGVTLATPKEMEVPAYALPGPVGDGESFEERVWVKRRFPGYDASRASETAGYYCPWAVMAFNRLPELRTGVLYLLGTHSTVFDDDGEDLLAVTGKGLGGSGGVEYGRVKVEMLEGSHLLPLENPTNVARSAAEWIVKEVSEEQVYRQMVEEERKGKSLRERQMLPPNVFEKRDLSLLRAGRL